MNIQECFEKRLLRKIAPDLLKVDSALKIAEHKLIRAKHLFSEEFFEEALITSYTPMFHAARALLYKEGVQEKGHFAVSVYLSEKFSQKISSNLIESFNIYQLERHKALYGDFNEVSGEQASYSLSDAEAFLQEVKEIYGTL